MCIKLYSWFNPCSIFYYSLLSRFCASKQRSTTPHSDICFSKMSSTEEVLKELNTEEIQQLQNFYKQYTDKLPHIYSFFSTALDWNARKPDENLATIYGPKNGSWKTNGTFIATFLPKAHIKLLFLYTYEESHETLKNAVLSTLLINWDQKPVCFFALQEQFRDLIQEVMATKGLNLLESTETNIWRIKKEKAIAKVPQCPDGFEFRDLKVEHTDIVNELWPHKAPGSECFVQSLIELNKSVGAFRKSDNALASWILLTPIGQLGLLQTKPEFAKKGLAMAVTDKLAKYLAEQGHDAIGTVLLNNQPSIKLFTKLGYEVIGLCVFMGYSK